MKQFAAFLVSAILLAVYVPMVSAGPVHPYDIKDTVKRVFAAHSGGRLEVDADMGNVEVTAGGSKEVRIVVERIVSVDSREDAKSILEAHNLALESKGNTVWVSSRINRDRFSWKRSMDRIRVRIIVEVPEDFDLDISSGAGNVSVVDVSGFATVKTGAGNIVTGQTSGEMDILTGSGNVDIRTAAGRVRVRNGSGNVTLDNVEGMIEAETGAGNVTARIVRELDGDSRLTTSAGNIKGLLAQDIGANVSAVAKVGSCSTDYPLEVTGSWMKKSFDGLINGGGPELSLRANVGNIVLSRLD